MPDDLGDQDKGATPIKANTTRHLCLARLRTASEALLRLIRQCWSLENDAHRARDAQLGEDGHRDASRTGAAVVSSPRTTVLNLLHRGGHRSIRPGFRQLADKGRPALGGLTTADITA